MTTKYEQICIISTIGWRGRCFNRVILAWLEYWDNIAKQAEIEDKDKDDCQIVFTLLQSVR